MDVLQGSSILIRIIENGLSSLIFSMTRERDLMERDTHKKWRIQNEKFSFFLSPHLSLEKQTATTNKLLLSLAKEAAEFQ